VPTGFVDDKYRIHPIYSISLFANLRNNGLAFEEGAFLHVLIPPKHIWLGYLMTDLLLQDFRDLFSENLAQFLSNEKENMFGVQKLHLKKRGDNRICSFPDQWLLCKSKEGRNVKK